MSNDLDVQRLNGQGVRKTCGVDGCLRSAQIKYSVSGHTLFLCEEHYEVEKKRFEEMEKFPRGIDPRELRGQKELFMATKG